jgi:hypothetical protein
MGVAGHGNVGIEPHDLHVEHVIAWTVGDFSGTLVGVGLMGHGR